LALVASSDLYAFDCNCVACVENWPEVSPVNDIAEQALFLCPKCRYKMGSSTCRRCGTNITKLVLQMGTHQQNFDVRTFVHLINAILIFN
jgi:hypothetical protein